MKFRITHEEGTVIWNPSDANTNTYKRDAFIYNEKEFPGDSFGLDLASLNLQRGREHGLPTYNKYVLNSVLIKSLTFISGIGSFVVSSLIQAGIRWEDSE